MTTLLLPGQTVAAAKTPTASLVVSPEYTVLGSVVTLDGRLSTDPDGQPLTYTFFFISVPIGSKATLEGMTSLNESGSMVSFAPDVVGLYQLGLHVSNGTYESAVAIANVDVRALMVPHARGLVPDGKFIWGYLRDVWSQVENKEFFETLWSALIQITGGELLKLYQVDFNKSIQDIQSFFQRRWLSYEPRLPLDEADVSFYLGNNAAGITAVTGAASSGGLAVITDHNEALIVEGSVRPDMAGRVFKIVYSRSPENVGASLTIAGLTPKTNGVRFTTDVPKNPDNVQPGVPSDVIARNLQVIFKSQSTTWSMGGVRRLDVMMTELLGFPYYIYEPFPGLENVRVGDVAVIEAGANAGVYRILRRSGAYIVVDHAPPSSSDAPDSVVTIYRPVGFTMPAEQAVLTDSVSIPLAQAPTLDGLLPGRLFILNGEAHVITRASVDENFSPPIVIISLEDKTVVAGQKELPWLVPSTLVSESLDFDALGVSAGDTFILDVHSGSKTSEIRLQVVGAVGNKLGFVVSTDPLQDGVVTPISDAALYKLATDLGISTVAMTPTGELVARDEAEKLLKSIASVYFQRAYWNTKLTSSSEIVVDGRTFTLVPRAVIRNRRVPVPSDVRSIPALQEYIKLPTVVAENGKLYITREDKKFEIPRQPVVLAERTQYLVDDENALVGELTYMPGSDLFEADGGDFIDLGILPGDTLRIQSPALIAGDYSIQKIISRNQLKLATPIPEYGTEAIVTSPLKIIRKKTGHFIRFIPGLFSAANAAPNRLWAEVSFFDNGENIERNFGILVGLTRQDLEEAEAGATYRQAVSGLMYAYVSGPAVSKIRLGVSLLLGLPFTEKRGIVRAVDEAYRKNSAGEPTRGRIVVEDLDPSTDEPTGLSRIYTFPVEANSALAGVDVNPATGVPYKVGDTVEAYASLAKGVEIDDLMSAGPGIKTAEAILQRYHSVHVKINDNIFQPSEVRLVSDFLRKITPSYLAVYIASTAELVDTVKVVDRLKLRFASSPNQLTRFADSVGFNSGMPAAFDYRTGFGFLAADWDGNFYTAIMAGDDLISQSDGLTLTSEAGGFVDPRPGEIRDGEWMVNEWDFVFIPDGPNVGLYPVMYASDDNTVILDYNDPILVPGITSKFLVVRKMENIVQAGGTIQHGSVTDPVTGKTYPYSDITIPNNVRSDYGYGPGDIFTAMVGGNQYEGWRAQVIDVHEGVTPGIKNVLRVTGLPNSTTDNYGLLARQRLYGAPDLYGDDAGYRVAHLDPGDEVEVSGERSVVLDSLSHVGGNYIPTVPQITVHEGIKKIKREWGARETTGLSFEQSLRDISDACIVKLLQASGDDAAIAGDTVTFADFNPKTAGIRPADFFIARSGDDSLVDVGYGIGFYPVKAVSDTTLTLTRSLTSASAQWGIARRR